MVLQVNLDLLLLIFKIKQTFK